MEQSKKEYVVKPRYYKIFSYRKKKRKKDK